MNMTKLAKLAGCSLSTVSKAFRNSPEISEETKMRIFEIAKEHNCLNKYYTPIYKRRVFAAICQEITSSVYGDIVETLNKKISENGDTFLISCSNFLKDSFSELINYYVNFLRVDGLIIIDHSGYDKRLIADVPTVLIGTISEENKHSCDCINFDRSYGMLLALKHLREMGHREIGFLGEYHTTSSKNMFKEAAKKLSLETRDEWIITSRERKGAAGADGIDRLFSVSHKPTAIYTAYDAIAFGAISKLSQAGLIIPEDLSIVSSNDLSISQYSTPPLTTVSFSTEEVTNVTLSLLKRRLKNRNAPYQSVTIQGSLSIRNSVKEI